MAKCVEAFDNKGRFLMLVYQVSPTPEGPWTPLTQLPIDTLVELRRVGADPGEGTPTTPEAFAEQVSILLLARTRGWPVSP